jgi:regulator of sirC expression with transglutaminase-like and TPR domain
MQATERFAALVRQPAAQVPLDEASMLIAAHAYPELDVGAELARLDELADRCFAPTLDALVTHLFTDLGFVGNVRDYYDPRNSYLNDVIDRRIGIPISLAVLTIEVGRRLGVPLAGVGMPGHFLLRDKVDDEVFVDPFARGRLLDRAGCEEAFRTVHGPDADFDPEFLDPVDTHVILARMLANLRAVFARRGDKAAVAWTLRLRTSIPGTPLEDRAELANSLAARGDFVAAAQELDALAEQLGGDLGATYRSSAGRLRARLN